MNTQLLITTIVTIALAAAGYLFTYLNNLRLAQRQEQLARVNRQLSELYEPLFARIEAGERIFDQYKERHGRPGGVWFLADQAAPPTEEELKEWRFWALAFFVPNNRQLYQAIITKSDLLIEDTMPEPLLQFCAHVAAYEITLSKWEAGNFSEHQPVIHYPRKSLLAYSRESFDYLKKRQEELTGQQNRKLGA